MRRNLSVVGVLALFQLACLQTLSSKRVGFKCDLDSECDLASNVTCVSGLCQDGYLGHVCQATPDCRGDGGLTCVTGVCQVSQASGGGCTKDLDCGEGQCITDICYDAGHVSLRGTFTRPWRSFDWTQPMRDTPLAGQYVTLDLDSGTIERQAKDLAYGHIQFGLTDWYGPGDDYDNALRADVARTNPQVKWAIEIPEPPQGADGGLDVALLKANFGVLVDAGVVSQPGYFRLHGKWVVFVDYASFFNCNVMQQWNDVADAVNAYIVQQVFDSTCFPDAVAWYQRAPPLAYDQQVKPDGGYFSAEVSPGYWPTSNPSPSFPFDPATFTVNVQKMVAAKPDFQLVGSYNNWVDDNAVEPSDAGKSDSGYGVYLDALHANPP